MTTFAMKNEPAPPGVTGNQAILSLPYEDQVFDESLARSTNEIVQPLNKAGNFGYDGFGQLFAWGKGDYGDKTGRGVHDVRKRKCVMCEQPWNTEDVQDVLDQMVDRSLRALVHYSCVRRHLAVKERLAVIEAFSVMEAVGGGEMAISETKNQYGAAWNNTWYRIDLENHSHHFIVGRRKRVWEIQVVTDDVDLIDFCVESFTEDVTKGRRADGYYIHAWSDDKLKEYARKLYEGIIGYQYPCGPQEEFEVCSRDQEARCFNEDGEPHMERIPLWCDRCTHCKVNPQD